MQELEQSRTNVQLNMNILLVNQWIFTCTGQLLKANPILQNVRFLMHHLNSQN